MFAHASDITALVEIGTTHLGRSLACRDTLIRFAESHIADPDKVCLVAANGPDAVICGVVAAHYLTGEMTAFKTAWAAKPGATGHGAHLLRAFERWARERGAQRILVSGREARTCTLLERRGYSRLETVYEKRVP
jgi:GNAT superfamily N-acetyltransferase